MKASVPQGGQGMEPQARPRRGQALDPGLPRPGPDFIHDPFAAGDLLRKVREALDRQPG
jgi:hypothetical protein